MDFILAEMENESTFQNLLLVYYFAENIQHQLSTTKSKHGNALIITVAGVM